MAAEAWKIAIEEACHGVVAHEYKKPVNRLSIEDRAANIGNIFDWKDSYDLPYVDPDAPPQRNWQDEKRAHRIHRSMAVFAAGSCGTRRIDRKEELISERVTDDAINRHKDVLVTAKDFAELKSDLDRSIALSKQLGDDVDVRKKIRRSEAMASKILKANWYKVIRIAKALMEHKTLEGPELDSLLRSGWRPWERF
jgi:hypothetical protein